jgi:oxygen-independent coproporphyrinogen-3 oxidase
MRIRGEDEKDALGVYVHIPYCLSKCPYCDFSSIAAGVVPEEGYVRCVLKELSTVVMAGNLAGDGVRLSSVYFGGGTPTLFSPGSIGRILTGVKRAFGRSDGLEVTLEANPETIGPGNLAGFRRAGVTRLSLGVQSFDEGELKALGRRHGVGASEAGFKAARDAGFDDIGVDLIFGIPGQALTSFERSLVRAIGLMPEHVSVYGLTIEDGTVFHGLYAGRDGVGLPGPDDQALIFEAAGRLLKDAGYVHYEISNWCLPGREGVHNGGYWKRRGYIGLGASAHSYLPYPSWGRRWWNERAPEAYMRRVEEGGSAIAGGEDLGREEAIAESVMLGLRMIGAGIDGESFRRLFGVYPGEALKGCAALEDEGCIERRGEDIVLTPRGVLLCNEVLLRL